MKPNQFCFPYPQDGSIPALSFRVHSLCEFAHMAAGPDTLAIRLHIHSCLHGDPLQYWMHKTPLNRWKHKKHSIRFCMGLASNVTWHGS